MTKTVTVKPKAIVKTRPQGKGEYIQKLSYPLFSEELLEFLGLYSAYEEFFKDKLKIERPKRQAILAAFGTALFRNKNKRKENVDGGVIDLNPVAFVSQAYSFANLPEHEALNIEGAVPINLLAECHSLFVYTDIVESSRVGDSYTQLLNVITVPPKAEFGEQVFVRFERPYYRRVSKSDFQQIEVEIKDDTIATAPFRFGRTIITLEFRRIQ